MTRHRTTLLLASGAVMSALLWVYGGVRLYSARDAALTARDELMECSRMSCTLGLLRSGEASPQALATLLPRVSAALGEASAQLGVPADAVRVGHVIAGSKAGVRLPIRLEGCTLEQLTALVYRLSSDPAAMRVESLVLAGSPRGQTQWDMDLTLTCSTAGEATMEGH